MSLTFIKGKKDGFTFPVARADLEDDIVDQFKMRAALKRFARELLRQRREHYPNTVGVQVHNIGISFVLGTYDARAKFEELEDDA